MRFAHFTVDQVSSLIGLPRRSGRGSKTGGLPAGGTRGVRSTNPCQRSVSVSES